MGNTCEPHQPFGRALRAGRRESVRPVDVGAIPLTAPAEELPGSRGGEAHEAVQRIVVTTLASGLLVYFR